MVFPPNGPDCADAGAAQNSKGSMIRVVRITIPSKMLNKFDDRFSTSRPQGKINSTAFRNGRADNLQSVPIRTHSQISDSAHEAQAAGAKLQSTHGEPDQCRRSGGNPIQGEGRETVARNVMDEAAHDDERDEEAYNKAYCDGSKADSACALENLVAALEG